MCVCERVSVCNLCDANVFQHECSLAQANEQASMHVGKSETNERMSKSTAEKFIVCAQYTVRLCGSWVMRFSVRPCNCMLCDSFFSVRLCCNFKEPKRSAGKEVMHYYIDRRMQYARTFHQHTNTVARSLAPLLSIHIVFFIISISLQPIIGAVALYHPVITPIQVRSRNGLSLYMDERA